MRVKDLIELLQLVKNDVEVFRGDDTYGLLPIKEVRIEVHQPRDLESRQVVCVLDIET